MKENNVNVVELTEIGSSDIDGAETFLNSNNIDLISDMPIELNVEIGGFNITVKDLYQLKPGMVMTLGSKVDEPVKVLFGESVVAEGVIVASDDHYALEITKVATINR